MTTLLPVQSDHLIAAELAQAIVNNQLSIVYQPQVESHSGAIAGFEALLRWQHPEIGVIPPSLFIPIAEATGLITELGDWILEQAIGQLKEWQHQYQHDLKMSVNISVQQLTTPGFIYRLQNSLEKHQLAPHSLELEVTESIAIEDFEEVRPILQFLQSLDIQIAIDDFGTGYASFTYLQLFCWDILKLDRRFVKNIHRNSVNAAITENLINMSHDLGFKVVAEGVEIQEEVMMLQQYGCDKVQGYYFSRPMTAASIATRFLGRKIAIIASTESCAA
ncbi:EAL domain-containing protein [Synechococcus moorigangaii CMS01]|nr:EAL domain-containing protein [Synechococcus moorigangaii CMS01]